MPCSLKDLSVFHTAQTIPKTLIVIQTFVLGMMRKSGLLGIVKNFNKILDIFQFFDKWMSAVVKVILFPLLY